MLDSTMANGTAPPAGNWIALMWGARTPLPTKYTTALPAACQIPANLNLVTAQASSRGRGYGHLLHHDDDHQLYTNAIFQVKPFKT